MAEEKVYINLAEDGLLDIESYPKITEKEIYDDRSLIVARLHTAYIDVQASMKPFQEDWDNNWVSALAHATNDGFKAGVNAWGQDFKEFFEKETWIELGDKIEKSAGSAWDTMHQYAEEQSERLVASVNEAQEALGEVIDDPTLLQEWVPKFVDDKVQSIKDLVDEAERNINETMDEIGEAAEKAAKMYKHREAIWGLIDLIAAGDAKGVQNFVDTVLMDIDPEYAKEIRENPNFYVVLEIINDHESALAFLAYAGIIFEAIPFNYYAYIAAKGAAYVLIEIVMIIITALLSAGTAAAARLGMLATRIATSSVKLASVSKKYRAIQKASDSVVAMIKDLERTVDDLHRLGEKLAIARLRDFTEKTKTKVNLLVKRQLIRRDKKCKICSSTKHRTPHGRLGTVHYE